MNRNLWLLAVCQGLFLTNNVAFIAINGLVGLSLAPLGWMATVPVMCYVLGSALSTGLVARTQALYGRKRSFQLGLIVALLATLLCAWAAISRNFWLLCLATAVAGYYNANAGLYRFAAAELALPPAREKAVSLVLIALLALAVLAFMEFPPAPAKASASAGRPLAQIIAQPVFVVAAVSGALGYGVMNLLMAATPIAMQQCSLPFPDAALVLQWHVIGMFVPGFFSGSLIRRFGALPVMGAGLVLNLGCVMVALSGVEVNQFLVALFLLGVGWNFLFTGSTTLSLTTYATEERDKAQGALNFCVFATLALTSLASGMLVTTQGWTLLNCGSLVPLALTGAALLWLAMRRQR